MRRGPSIATRERRQRVFRIFDSGVALCSRELVTLLGASKSTIHDDIRALRREGYDIIASPGAGGGYRLRRKAALGPAGAKEGD